MATTFRKAMDALYLLCIGIAGAALIIMTAVIPYGVYTRKILNAAAAWPEPLSVLMMILFSFFGGAASYRANSHISVRILTDALPPAVQRVFSWFVDFCMAAICLFMLYWGLLLVQTVWPQTVAEFPFLSTGITYLPIPVGGIITLLFIIERVLIGPPPKDSIVYREPIATE